MKASIPKVASIALIAVTVMTFLCVGCNAAFVDPDIAVQQKCETLLQYFSNKDAKNLKNIFCERAKTSPELDRQIQAGLQFFQGKVVSHDSLTGIGTDGTDIDHGKVTKIDAGPCITNVVTDCNRKYDIRCYMYLICAADKNKEGISDIVITASNGQKCEIGKYIK